MAAIPANTHRPETGYPLDQCGRSHRGEKEKTVNVQRLTMNSKTQLLCSAIASSSAKEPRAKKQKINKKNSDGDGRSILVRAFAGRGEEYHVAEAEITLDSDGALAVDYVAAKLLLKGTLYVSDIPFGGSKILTRLRLFTQGIVTCINQCPRIS
jgi:hypothetical protein